LRVVLSEPDVLAGALIAFTIPFVGQTVDAFFPIRALGMGLTLTQIGLLRGWGSIVTTMVRPLAPYSFRLARLRTINAANVLVAASVLLVLPHLTAFPALAGLFFGIGLARGVSRVTGSTLISRRGRHTGLASGVFNAGLDLGGIVGPMLGGVIAARTGIPAMFPILGVVLIVFYFSALGLSQKVLVPKLGVADPRGGAAA
jgi:predicted MFS family arabinose efflux permease